MSKKLAKLETNPFFKYFEEICSIPHESGNCKELSDYCVQFAEEHNLEYRQDEFYNVIIWKDASKGREEDPTVMLQGHLDMVCVKTMDSHFNFEEDALELDVDGDNVFAKNTSLGADDGIAVAYALAILADDRLSTPPLEVVFTVDEEVGMIGASKIDLDGCCAKYLINMDSESDNVLWAGCAGGASVTSTFTVRREDYRGITADIKITGLQGGHSGAEIDKELANANVLMGRVLDQLKSKCRISLIDLQGGKADNVITGECTAKVLLDFDAQYYFDQKIVGTAPESYQKKKIREIKKLFRELDSQIKKEYKNSDRNISITIDILNTQKVSCIDMEDTEKIVFFLRMMPYGVLHMSTKVQGLVETSANPGILTIDDTTVKITFSVRSSVESRKNDVIAKIINITEFVGGKTMVDGDYPGWDIKKTSALRKHMIKVYKEMYGKKPEVQAIHAGLECGYILAKMPGLDIVSIGPDIYDIHSVNERLNMPSAKKMYKYIVKVLETIK